MEEPAAGSLTVSRLCMYLICRSVQSDEAVVFLCIDWAEVGVEVMLRLFDTLSNAQ